ncbi:cell division protein ZapE [Quadrisphaera setariae]|uniref:cell division protein ZapE n=1 Tax=Quadrisphaera setariae TaxID=2593304 RepID=UPI001650BCDE|nr:cell division protein ZapE [Quadrisphaera setariae]
MPDATALDAVETTDAVPSLVQRDPRPSPQRLLDDLVPPPHFAAASFDTYRPDPSQPTQADAVAALRDRAGRWSGAKGSKGARGGGLAKLFGRGGVGGGAAKEGIYLDGGFGVGKTHLLTSLFHAVDSPTAPAAYGTFVEYTNLAGALGFRQAVEALSAKRLVCIDEFELDDPGDTVLMSRLLRELSDAGTALAATSNTLPDALGEGRFAAEDFLREIQAVASRFDVYRVDGEDYRHRGLPAPPEPATDAEVRERAAQRLASGEGVVLDSFDALLGHLATVHPSRYGALLDGVTAVHWTGVRPVSDQSVALRLVVLGDRMYDRDLPLVASGAPLDQLFPDELMNGGYRKKYARAVSRLTALAREGSQG